jgi:histone deacetylase 6
VLYISIHRYENASFYPNDTSGSYSSKGEDRGLGLCVPSCSGFPVRSGSSGDVWDVTRPSYLTIRFFLLISSVNIPWSKGGKGDGDYLYAFEKMVMPIAKEFAPEIVLGRRPPPHIAHSLIHFCSFCRIRCC